MWRWRRRQLLILFLALLVATLATWAVGRPSRPGRVAEVPEVVAGSPLTRGTVLNPGLLRVVRVPRTDLPPGALASPAAAGGMVLTADLGAGDPVLSGDLETAGEAGLSYRIPAGERAMTVAATETSGVGGHLRAGDRVDAVVVLTGGPAGGATASLFLADVPVLAIQNGGKATVGNPVGGYGSVTLGLTPAQAVRLALAEQVGIVELLLRPAGDTSRVKTMANEGSLLP